MFFGFRFVFSLFRRFDFGLGVAGFVFFVSDLSSFSYVRILFFVFGVGGREVDGIRLFLKY